MSKAGLDPRETGPLRRSGRIDAISSLGQEVDPQGTQGPEAEVVGRAAADAEKDGADAGLGRGPDQLAGADGRGPLGIPHPWRQLGEPAGGRHLDDGDGSPEAAADRTEPGPRTRRDAGQGDDAERGVDFSAPGPRHLGP